MIADTQALIIGLTIGGVALLVIIVIIVICCCCRKAERSCLRRGMKRMDKQFEKDKKDLTDEQKRRKEDMMQKHTEIRSKYGLNSHNSDIRPQQDNIYSVENEQISLALR